MDKSPCFSGISSYKSSYIIPFDAHKVYSEYSIAQHLQPTEHYVKFSMLFCSHTHSLVMYISQYNDYGLMISEYKIYLLKYSCIISYVIFFLYFLVMCAVSLIKKCVCVSLCTTYLMLLTHKDPIALPLPLMYL